jgi:MFS-type transporter involved in bile tolerance (Atg22 family)
MRFLEEHRETILRFLPLAIFIVMTLLGIDKKEHSKIIQAICCIIYVGGCVALCFILKSELLFVITFGIILAVSDYINKLREKAMEADENEKKSRR